MPADDDIALSRRKVLGSVGSVGTAGALGGVTTTSLLWDEETFGNATDPNVLRAGQLDLTVDYRAQYFDDIAGTDRVLVEQGLTDQPGVLVRLRDVKSADVLELSTSLHVFHNPAFVFANGSLVSNGDADVAGVEDRVDDGNVRNGSDGTAEGDLLDNLWCVLWYDGATDGFVDFGTGGTAGNGFPDEFADGVFPDRFGISSGDPDDREEFYRRLARLDPTTIAVSADDLDPLIHFGRLRSLLEHLETGFRLDPFDAVAPEFSSGDCFRPSVTHYVGLLAWLPADAPGVNDNVVQTDLLEFVLGYDAIQCRHNVADDGGPIDATIEDADPEAE